MDFIIFSICTDIEEFLAKIYTWLAWQEEPGRQLHQAIKYGILNPEHPKAQTFVTWFKTLYEL
ncbi:MAG: DUF3226 domain-containing protein [Nostoc sp.]|uniref:DUF3226 domain-containing protein n=1 Tax=Nostoc sp. TaxID=1180 RepID=UPI002FF37383